MKASDFITHLQKMIEEHGDLPLAMIEVNEDLVVNYVEYDGELQVSNVLEEDCYYDEKDKLSKVTDVFLID